MRFTWDPAKNDRNIAKHGIDFVDAIRVFDNTRLYVYRSDRHGEERYTAIGPLESRTIAVAYTDRIERSFAVRRIISARRARRYEIQAYQAYGA